MKQYLDSVLSRLPLLEGLQLSDNRFGDDGLIVLAHALHQLNHPHRLEIMSESVRFSDNATSYLPSALSSPNLATHVESGSKNLKMDHRSCPHFRFYKTLMILYCLNVILVFMIMIPLSSSMITLMMMVQMLSLPAFMSSHIFRNWIYVII